MLKKILPAPSADFEKLKQEKLLYYGKLFTSF